MKLDRVTDGVYSAAFIDSSAGVDPCRVRAEGYFNRRTIHSREDTDGRGLLCSTHFFLPAGIYRLYAPFALT